MQVKVQTSQNVFIHYEIASLGARIGAFLIDLLIMLAYLVLAFIIYFRWMAMDAVWPVIIIYLPVFLYHLISELLMDGQSIGKKQLHIKVIKLNGSQPGLGSFLLRWILRSVDILFYGAVAILCIIIGGKGQRLGDMAAGTAVINTKRKLVKPNTNILKESLQEDYIPTFRQVTNLKEKDIGIIIEVLRNYKKTGYSKPLIMLSDKTKSVLGVETKLTPYEFLYKVVKDYNHLVANV